MRFLALLVFLPYVVFATGVNEDEKVEAVQEEQGCELKDSVVKYEIDPEETATINCEQISGENRVISLVSSKRTFFSRASRIEARQYSGDEDIFIRGDLDKICYGHQWDIDWASCLNLAALLRSKSSFLIDHDRPNFFEQRKINSDPRAAELLCKRRRQQN